MGVVGLSFFFALRPPRAYQQVHNRCVRVLQTGINRIWCGCLSPGAWDGISGPQKRIQIKRECERAIDLLAQMCCLSLPFEEGFVNGACDDMRLLVGLLANIACIARNVIFIAKLLEGCLICMRSTESTTVIW